MTEEFTDHLEADDWKDAAAIVGLIRFFDYAQIPYNKEEIERAKEIYDNDSEYDEGLDVLRFNAADITDEKLDAFIEDYFAEELHHCAVERALHKTDWSKEEVDFINGKLTANTAMKDIFPKQKFDGTNAEKILDLIEENRSYIVRKTFVHKPNLYKNFCNVPKQKIEEFCNNLFQKPENKVVRLQGYHMDLNHKGRSISYRFNEKLFSSSDSRFYDFIPFAFTIGRESFLSMIIPRSGSWSGPISNCRISAGNREKIRQMGMWIPEGSCLKISFTRPIFLIMMWRSSKRI